MILKNELKLINIYGEYFFIIYSLYKYDAQLKIQLRKSDYDKNYFHLSVL